MNKNIANYTVIIEKQKRLGTGKDCFAAYVPVLGLAIDADSIEAVEKEVKSLIEFHIQSLAEEGETIPVESEETLVTRSKVVIPFGARLAA